ncbi:DUF4184 family protein [Chamaesiphon sp.]|uniref:DUF4184 family protein n=1 Tax=Chamaesiphon sp. TaxID=2814140 RepID=UPI0035933959
MPFTLAHPIAAVPIWWGSKQKLHLASLAIGSMIPDADYFLFLYPSKTIGHTFHGIFIQGVPYSIVLLLVIRYVLLRPFLALIPLKLAQKFPSPKQYFPLSIFELFNIMLSIAIGAATHLIWDALTHTGDSGIHSEFLKLTIGSLQVYTLLHYGGGIFGLVALSFWLATWLHRAKLHQRVETLAPGWRVLAIIGIVYCALGVAWIAAQDNREPFVNFHVRSLIGAMSGVFLGLLLYSIVFWICSSFRSDSNAA